MKKLLSTLLLTVLVFPPGLDAQAPDPQTADPPAKPASIYDKVWRFTKWYENDANPVVESVLFTGRFQEDYAIVEADQGSHSEWNVRRFRVGLKSKWFRDFTLHGEVELNPQEAAPVYTRLTDVYLMWSRSAKLEATLGKQSIPFTLDGSTSSKELLTIDRSNLANNIWFPQEYLPGFTVAGEIAPWIYHAGVYSSGRANKEFGEFNGGISTLAVIGYDFANRMGVEEALLAANYVYQNPDIDNTFTRRLQHVVSINFKFDGGPWGVRADVSTASGYLGQSDLWGVVTMPFFDITPKLQVIGRHTYVTSENPNGVLLATYENQVVAGRGDRYNEFYFGANYYFYGHKLKLQSGLQFADMNDRANDGGTYSGVSWTNGLRVSW